MEQYPHQYGAISEKTHNADRWERRGQYKQGCQSAAMSAIIEHMFEDCIEKHSTRVMRMVCRPRPVPAALEAVHAGFPSVAQDYFAGDFSLDKHVIVHPGTTFIVRVAGDSMEGAGIFDGDLMIVDRSLDPVDGDVVIAVLDGELTVKQLLIDASGPRLHPENPRYPDFRPSGDERLFVWGVVTGSYHPQRTHGAASPAEKTAARGGAVPRGRIAVPDASHNPAPAPHRTSPVPAYPHRGWEA